MEASETVGEDSRGYDGGKSRDGRKRHILTDTEGLLLEVTVTTADVHDSKGGVGGGAVRTSRTDRRTTASTVGSSRTWSPLRASSARRRVTSPATTSARPETAIRARWDRP
ncbi:transposase [Streptomyces sp. NPDC059629]|uniref:transposase n=1 Tax=Streptomyces sp. NPDC059629 TaxID=3346889 RepID=UPI00368CE567